MNRTPTARISRAHLIPALLVLLLAAPLLSAAPAAAASRPFAITESAVALPPGGARLEAGLSREDWDNGLTVYAFAVELSYSLYANLDLELEVPWVVAGASGAFDDGFGDTRARAKINFLKERAANPLTLSGLLEVKFPTGDRLVSSDEADVRLAGLASKTFGPAQVHGNLFYTFVGDPSGVSLKNVLGLSVGASVQTPMENLLGVGEFIWEQARLSGGDDRLELMGGGQYAVADGLAVDATLRLGFASNSAPSVGGAPDYTLGVGLTWDLGTP
jgi:hypothetical protein